MHTDQWKQIKDILAAVLEMDAAERRPFLDRSKVDPAMRAEIESLMHFEDESANLMQLSAVEFSKDFIEDDGALSGQQVGPYQVIRELGHGGMGAVYLADRIDGKFQQRVAVKLLKREMNTSALRRHFEQEREILASLEHPNIARLLDAGTTDDKIPYLAMEYVDGQPIDEYCNSHDLDLTARLELFRTVCSAVDFAHRNLIVHRDLKPSNIIVTGDGTPKLLDFGISKILSADIGNAATITKLGVMTPGYASPEQLRNESVTTSTDVYSLGVILYELLSGHRPFETKEGNLGDIYQAVIEIDPPPPSSISETITRELENMPPTVIDNGYEYTSRNEMRHTAGQSAAIKAQDLQGDLDNIVIKALKKEPERRYRSAETFAEDIKRHLDGLPVTARPDTFTYRAEKFVKRNRFTVVAGSLILIAIIAGIVATLWQARVAAAERDRAQFEAKKSRKINDYMLGVLNFSNPNWLSSNPKQNRDAKISDALDEALKNIDADLADEPEIQGEILFTIGQTFIGQTSYDKAEPLLRRAIEKFAQVSDVPLPKAMQAKVMLGDALRQKGKNDEAEKLYLEAIEYFRPAAAKDTSLVKWLVIPLNNLGNTYNNQGRFAEAKQSIGEANEHLDEVTGQDRYVVPLVMGNLGASYTFTGDFETALMHYSRSMEEFRKVGNEKKYEAGQILNATGRAYVLSNDYQMAEKTLREAREVLTNTVGEKNSYFLVNLYWVATNLYNQGRYSEAEVEVKKLRELLGDFYPNGHVQTGNADRLLGEIYTKTNRLKEGEEKLREAVEYVSKKVAEPNPQIAQAKAALGENLVLQKKYAEATEFLTAALDGYLKTSGEGHPFTKQCRELLNSVPK